MIIKTSLILPESFIKIYNFLQKGCAFATESEWQWQAGKQYAFEYSGRLLTGIPELASHYAGLGVEATVLIDVLSPTKLQLSLAEPRFARVNEVLQANINAKGKWEVPKHYKVGTYLLNFDC